jgi:hypothetical protein
VNKRDTSLQGEETAYFLLLQDSQVMPTRPSNKERIRVKTLGWRAAKACDKENKILIFSLLNFGVI